MLRKALLIAPSALFVFLAAFAFREQPISFADIKQASFKIDAAGYTCTSDRADGKLQFGFMVTRESTDWQAVGTMSKVGKLGPDWQGKVWVTKIGEQFQLESTPDTPDVRVWGRLIAYGDRALLDELERTLRRL